MRRVTTDGTATVTVAVLNVVTLLPSVARGGARSPDVGACRDIAVCFAAGMIGACIMPSGTHTGYPLDQRTRGAVGVALASAAATRPAV
jgi:hypothetical protein